VKIRTVIRPLMELRNIFVSDKRTIRLRHVTEIINPTPQKHFMQMLARKNRSDRRRTHTRQVVFMDYHSNKPRTKIKQRLHKPASRSEQSLANDPIKLTEAWRSATGCEPTCLYLMRRCVKKASRYGNAQKQRANKCSRTAQAKGKKDDVRKGNMVTSRARFNHI